MDPKMWLRNQKAQLSCLQIFNLLIFDIGKLKAEVGQTSSNVNLTIPY